MKKFLLPLALFRLISCNKDFGDYFDQEIKDFSQQSLEGVKTIAKGDNLYSFLSFVSKSGTEALTDVGCIEFIYPFIIFRFDEEDNYINQVSVFGNENFSTLLDELEDGYSICLSYPMMAF